MASQNVSGSEIINVCKHGITFGDPADPKNGNVVTVAPSGTVINATPCEVPAGTKGGAELVKSSFRPDPESLSAIERIEAEFPGAIIVGSMIAAQAYPGRVFAMTPLPGFEREAPDKKRMNPKKFTSF